MGPCIIFQDLQQKPWKSSQTPWLNTAAGALAGLPQFPSQLSNLRGGRHPASFRTPGKLSFLIWIMGRTTTYLTELWEGCTWKGLSPGLRTQ